MTLLSVITPVAEDTAAEHLANAHESLISQELPHGWTWEWVIQVDGPNKVDLPKDALVDPRIHLAYGPHGGPGVARNLALARSAGTLIANLDADDQFTPGALDRIIGIFNDKSVGWTTSAMTDLLPDGSQQRFNGDPEPGKLTQGSVTAYWKTHDWAMQVHPTTLAARREILVAVGGWMALTVSEDMGLLVALDNTAPGAFIAEPGILHRVHPKQMTRLPEHPLLVAQLRNLLCERAQALHTPQPSTIAIEEREFREKITSFTKRALALMVAVYVCVMLGIGIGNPHLWTTVLFSLAVSSVALPVFGGLYLWFTRKLDQWVPL